MTDTLYFKRGSEYIKWGSVHETSGASLPYGLWWVYYTESSRGSSNVFYQLADHDDFLTTKVVIERLKLKETILSILLEITKDGASLSLDDMA